MTFRDDEHALHRIDAGDVPRVADPAEGFACHRAGTAGKVEDAVSFL